MDSQSAELRSYLDHSSAESSNEARNASPVPSSDEQEIELVTVTPSKARPRGANWSAVDRLCFITALDNHNPWTTASREEALTAWTDALD